jgi:hypothetical protein
MLTYVFDVSTSPLYHILPTLCRSVGKRLASNIRKRWRCDVPIGSLGGSVVCLLLIITARGRMP